MVSRGGRPDLAGESLREVRAPTLLIVGGRDEMVLKLNRQDRRRSLPSARSPWSLPPPTFSRNRARSSKWWCWRATGSSTT